jgi:Xaa-Pro aminopeptidase
MTERGIAAYVVPSSDPHQSEYPPARHLTRGWLSGFTGSAGTLVITATEAGLWTDSRYYLAAEQALAGTGIKLFKHGTTGVPDYPVWLAKTLTAGDVVSFDAEVVSPAMQRGLADAVSPHGIVVRAGEDLPGMIWDGRPELPSKPIYEHDVKFAGASRGEKLSRLREAVAAAGASHHLICTLDDIAWLLNLRGSDVSYNPVFLAFLLVSANDTELYVEPGKIPGEIGTELERDGVTVVPYGEIYLRLERMDERDTVLLAPDRVNVRMAETVAARATVIEAQNPSTLAKARKNATELECVRKAMVRDGVAMARFLSWLDRTVGNERITELTAEEKLRSLRSEGDQFVSEAFRTISAYRGHAALPHYAATPESDALLEPAGLYLVDSGAQYRDGTTDITRTVPLGPAGAEERTDYTLVLKAHIGLATLRYPKGTTGHAMDVVSRRAMWNRRVNYGHGTGHGVGFFLNVHEGPQRISTHPSSVALEVGMITSNEPGIYRPGRYGIRIENLVVTVEDQESEFDDFLRFETVTLCPIDTRLVDVQMLDTQEVEWLNAYHRHVRDSLLGHLSGTDAQWLEERCAPL